MLGEVEVTFPMARRKKIKIPKLRHNVDLLNIFDELNLQYFGGLLCGGIGWRNFVIGKENTTLGHCICETRFINISTLLLDTRVPMFYLKYIVYHEMVHLFLGPQFRPDGSQEDPHNNKFKVVERKYKQYARAIAFHEGHIPELMEEWRQLKLMAKKVKR